MRSRWRGSMLAWILNTKPENGASTGATAREPASRGCGAGAHLTSACRISCTPKLLMPEPKNTGVCVPARNLSSSNGWLAPRSSSMSCTRVAASCGNSAASRGLSTPRISSVSRATRASPGVKRSSRSSSR